MNILKNCTVPPEYSVLFPDTVPPGPDAISGLKPTRVKPGEDGGWVVEFDSLKGCEVRILCDPDPRVDLAGEISISPGLSDKEKERVGRCQSRWHVLIDPGDGPVLKTRKSALIALGQLLKAVQTSVGVYAVGSIRVWSLEAIADELMTKAPVDIDSLYCIHAVSNPNGSRWVHTHGLEALGGFDIDLINPSDEMLGCAHTFIQALVFAILEGALGIDEPIFQIAVPRGMIRMAPAQEFDRAVSSRFAGIRDIEDGHTDNRAVVCEPGRGKRLWRLKESSIEPSRFVMKGFRENMVFALSKSSSDLLAERAQETYPVLVKAMKEFASLELPVLIKAGCPVDSGDGLEHIWFQVNSADINGFDGTCLNQPYEVSGLNEGDRGRYGLGQITEWQMQTPMGSLSPGNLGMIRTVQSNREEIERIMREFHE